MKLTCIGHQRINGKTFEEKKMRGSVVIFKKGQQQLKDERVAVIV